MTGQGLSPIQHDKPEPFVRPSRRRVRTVKLSLKTLKNVPEGELTEFIWDAYLNGLDSDTSPGLRIAKLTILFRSEMDNGGIQQYITNHTCSPGHDVLLDSTVIHF